jgi:hypothetical protein
MKRIGPGTSPGKENASTDREHSAEPKPLSQQPYCTELALVSANPASISLRSGDPSHGGSPLEPALAGPLPHHPVRCAARVTNHLSIE